MTVRIVKLSDDLPSVVDVVGRVIDCAAGRIHRAEITARQQEGMPIKTRIDIVAHDLGSVFVEAEREREDSTREIDVRVGVSNRSSLRRQSAHGGGYQDGNREHTG